MTQSLPFQQLMPGLGQLQTLMQNAFKLQQGAGHQSPLGGWLQPPLTQEQIESRIAELRTVLYWLEQNVHAVKATIEALEVQRLTFSALSAMNVNVSEMAKAFRMPDWSGQAGVGAQSHDGMAGDGKAHEATPDAAADSEALDPSAWLRPWAQVFGWSSSGGQAPSGESSAAEPEPSAPVTPHWPQSSRGEQPEPSPAQTSPDRAKADETVKKEDSPTKEALPTPTMGIESAPLQWWQMATRQFQALASSALENPKAVDAWVQAGQRAQQAISTGTQDVVAALNEVAKAPLKGATTFSKSMVPTSKKASRADPGKVKAQAKAQAKADPAGEGARAARKGSPKVAATVARKGAAKSSPVKRPGSSSGASRGTAASPRKTSAASAGPVQKTERSTAAAVSKPKANRSTGTASSRASASAAASKAKPRSVTERQKT